VLAHGQTWQSATDRTNTGLIAVAPSAQPPPGLPSGLATIRVNSCNSYEKPFSGRAALPRSPLFKGAAAATALPCLPGSCISRFNFAPSRLGAECPRG